MRRSYKIWLVLASVIVVTGCQSMLVGSDLDAVPAEFEMPSVWSTTIDEDTASLNLSLLSLVHVEALDGLVEQAMLANPDLEQTLLTLRIGQLEAKKTQSSWWPSIQAGFSQNRNSDEAASYIGNVSLDWEIDLFGSTLDSVRASEFDVTEQRALYEAARNTLVAQVIKTWLLLTNQYRVTEIQEQRVASLTKTEGFIVQRFRSGLGSSEDLNSARSRRLQAEATLRDQNETLEQLRRGLLVLTGQTPMAKKLVSIAPNYPSVVTPIVNLPQQTLAGRPDVRAAYAAIQAANLRQAVAYKDLLPGINIQAALQESGTTPAEALLKDPVWTLLSQLSVPIFQGGALKISAQQQELQVAAAIESYRSVLLSAVQEIEDSLGLEVSLAQQEALLQEALLGANKNLQQYQRNYRSGLVTILDLLTVEQNTFDLRSQLETVKYNRLSNRIDLGLALGLGYLDRGNS